MKKRLISMALVLVMVLGLMPVGVFAASTPIKNTTLSITIDSLPIYQEYIPDSVNMTVTGENASALKHVSGGWATGFTSNVNKQNNIDWASGQFEAQTDYILIVYFTAADGYRLPGYSDSTDYTETLGNSNLKFDLICADDPTLKPYKVEGIGGYSGVGGSDSNTQLTVAFYYHSRAYVGSSANAMTSPWNYRIASFTDLTSNGFASGVAVKDLELSKAFSGEKYHIPAVMGSDGKQKFEIWQGSTRLGPDDTLKANEDYKLRFTLRIFDTKYYSFCPDVTAYVDYPIEQYATVLKKGSSDNDYVFEAPFRLSASAYDLGTYYVSLTDGMADVYNKADNSEKADALDNTLALLAEEYGSSSGDMDLDQDGVWDIRPVMNGGKLYWNPNPDTNMAGRFTFSLTSEQIKSSETNAENYYSKLDITFLGKNLGTAVVDLSNGPALFPTEDEGFSIWAMAYLLAVVFTGEYKLDMDGDGNYDITIGTIEGDSSNYFIVMEGTDLEGEYLYAPYAEEDVNNVLKNGGSVYEDYLFFFPTKGKDLGDKTFDLSKGAQAVDEPIVDEELLVLATQGLIKRTGDLLDLDKDGKNDVEFFDNGGVLSLRVLKTTNLLGQSVTVDLPDATKDEYTKAGTDYYGTVTFQFPESVAVDLGALTIDMTEGTAKLDTDRFNAALATLEALQGSKVLITAGDPAHLDLNMDGVYDVDYAPNAGQWEFAPAPATSLSGDFTLELDKTALMALTDSGAVYYSTILFRFPEAELVNPFVDVAESDYFYDPVLWAFYHDPQITNGTDPTHFSPDQKCTRGQVVTFLWRAAGCPEPISGENPFTDVDPKFYYYKAVLWAVEQKITNGTSATTFSPDAFCTRGQVVTFLYRALDASADATENPFTDLNSGYYYYEPVLWAVQNKITNGTSATTFSPDADCTRGQIVTFLYRALHDVTLK